MTEGDDHDRGDATPPDEKENDTVPDTDSTDE